MAFRFAFGQMPAVAGEAMVAIEPALLVDRYRGPGRSGPGLGARWPGRGLGGLPARHGRLGLDLAAVDDLRKRFFVARKATSARTDVRTGLSPRSASCCSSLQNSFGAAAPRFALSQFVAARPAGLLIPR